MRNDELEAAWAVCDPLVSAIESGYLPMTTYSYGSRGPKEADELENESWAFTVAFGREGFGAAVERGIRYVAGRGGRHDGILASKLSNAVYVSEPVVKKNKPVNEGYALSPRGYRSGDVSPQQQRSPKHSQMNARPSTQWLSIEVEYRR